MSGGYGISEWPDIDALYRRFKELVSQPIRPLRPDGLAKVMKYFDMDVRIAYADTDRMGVIYYDNYLVLFERGRTEYLRSMGLRYRDLEEQKHVFLPVMDALRPK